MNGLYLGIGGNTGNRTNNLAKAQKLIAEKIGPVIKQSSIYETEAWGNEGQANFYNQVLFVRTDLNPEESLLSALEIEKKLGRVREKKWSARTIDIDILFFNKKIIKSKKLTIPHPYLHERNFVLIPLAEIASHYIHPVFRKKIFTLLKQSSDKLAVKKVTAIK